VGSNLVAHWGSVGFFGPLTVHPDFWDKGIGKRLIEPVLDLFSRWQTTFTGLYTFADSPRHAALYQKFGFWPRFLTAVMSMEVRPAAQALNWTRFSAVPASEQAVCLSACQSLTGSVFDGLDLSQEISAVAAQHLGDTVLLWDGSRLSGLAVCHNGPGTEAGSGTCYIKFGAVRPGPTAESAFRDLLTAAGALANLQGAARLVAGVNTARIAAYHSLIDLGFRTDFQGVVMTRMGEPGYNRPDVFLIDDWR
jgi:hypothetical protein